MKHIRGIRTSNISIFRRVSGHTVIRLYRRVLGESVVGIMEEWQDSL